MSPADHSENASVLCPVCGVPQRHRLLLCGSEGYGSIYRCTGCFLARLLPLPSPDNHLLNIRGMYETKAHIFDEPKAALAARSVQGYLSKIRSLGVQPATLVDLAAGLGYYSRAFCAQGLDVTYVDADTVSVQFARIHNDAAGVRTICGTIEDYCAEGNNRYDVIFFRHAIEHCVSPDHTLRLIGRLAHPDTVIIVETDNNLGIEMFFHPEARDYWRGVYRDHYNEGSLLRLFKLRPLAIDWKETHYYAFRLGNLATLLRATGWQVLDSFTYSLGDMTYWPNLSSARNHRWWQPRCNLSEWSRNAIYGLIHPFLRYRGWTSGIAFYAKRNAVGIMA